MKEAYLIKKYILYYLMQPRSFFYYTSILASHRFYIYLYSTFSLHAQFSLTYNPSYLLFPSFYLVIN